jgi:hypothetical protein
VLPAVLDRLGIRGPVALVSAGWRFDEARDEPLREALGRPVHNLALYERFRVLERELPELAGAYSAKQQSLRAAKAQYRNAIVHAHHACAELWESRKDPACPWFNEAVRHLQSVDALFLSEAERMHGTFGGDERPLEDPRVRAQLDEIDAQLAGCEAVLIAGGHVGVLRNRLAFYHLGERLGGKHVIAWSAGAMCLTERILLFHDGTTFGGGTAEFLDRGLGLVKGVVYLPHARQRLDLDNATHVSVLARRLAPARAIGLQNGGVLIDGRHASGAEDATIVLREDGRVLTLKEEAACSS